MITKWELSNFKSFYNKTGLNLAPLTVLTGINSSGKSSIIQSMLLIAQTLRNPISSRELVLNGSLVKMGFLDDIISNNEKNGFDLAFNIDYYDPKINFEFNISFNKQIKLDSITIFKRRHKEIIGEFSAGRDLVYYLNSHGCLCSQDDEIFKKCSCSERIFKDDEGKPVCFSLHLKPITFTKNGIYDDLTRRIYFKWGKDKFLIGWIGKHPINCSECKEEYHCSKLKH